MKSIELKPASYSKAQTVDQIKDHIQAWPLQDTNNPQAYAHSVEFVDLDNQSGPVGTLSEYFDQCGFNLFSISAKDGYLVVTRKENYFMVISYIYNQ